MKKVLLVLILALMPIYVLAARVAATTETVASSSKTVFDDVRSMTSDLKEALTPLAVKLGQGAEHLYRLAVRQSYVEGWISLTTCICMLILNFVAYKRASRTSGPFRSIRPFLNATYISSEERINLRSLIEEKSSFRSTFV